jgi:hypothetical protein
VDCSDTCRWLHKNDVAEAEADGAQADDDDDVRPDSQEALAQAQGIRQHIHQITVGYGTHAFPLGDQQDDIRLLEEITGRNTQYRLLHPGRLNLGGHVGAGGDGGNVFGDHLAKADKYPEKVEYKE